MDRALVAPQYGAEPDAGFPVQRYIAQHEWRLLPPGR